MWVLLLIQKAVRLWAMTLFVYVWLMAARSTYLDQRDEAFFVLCCAVVLLCSNVILYIQTNTNLPTNEHWVGVQNGNIKLLETLHKPNFERANCPDKCVQQHYMQPVDIADRPGKVNNKSLQPSHVLEILQIQFPMLWRIYNSYECYNCSGQYWTFDCISCARPNPRSWKTFGMRFSSIDESTWPQPIMTSKYDNLKTWKHMKTMFKTPFEANENSMRPQQILPPPRNSSRLVFSLS